MVFLLVCVCVFVCALVSILLGALGWSVNECDLCSSFPLVYKSLSYDITNVMS